MTALELVRDTCRSCSAPIVWCVSERGKSMPVNAEPETGGNLAVEARTHGHPLARVVSPAHAFGRTDLHKSHFATCEHAAKWRKKRSAP